MTAAPLRFVFDPQGEELAAAKQCEADVFLEAYNNTSEQFDIEYGAYEDATGFMTVLEDDGTAVGTVRFIAPGPAGLKTLNDVSRPPWQVDGLRSARAAGVDPDRTWDIATIAVRRGSGRGGLCASALYHGIINAAFANEIDFIVMIMDSHARQLLTSLGMQTQALPGTKTGEYLGSTSSTPLWANLSRGMEQQRQDSPEAYRLIRQGIGLDGITLPTDWTWNRST
jgi:N-acyl-L-homoserine lactone synthetase